MTATHSRPRSVKKVYPAVSVTATVLVRPACCCRLLPAGKPGMIEIASEDNTQSYSIAYVADRQDNGDITIHGYRLTTGKGEPYDVPEDLSSCTCGDFTFRVRPGGCRHMAALRQLREDGVIA